MRGSGAKVGCRDTSLKGTAVTLETERSEPEAPAGGGAPQGRGVAQVRSLRETRGQNGQDVFTAGKGARRVPSQGNRPSRSLMKAACRGPWKGHRTDPGLALF